MHLIERSVPRGDGRVFYWTNGAEDKPAIVFLHGAGVDHGMFAAQLEFFGEGYRTLAWDARCHGKSRDGFPAFRQEDVVEDLVALLEAEGIGRATLVGQSMGGNIAQELALGRPDLVEGLVVIDSTRNVQRLSAGERLSLKLAAPIFRLYPWTRLVEDSARACSTREVVRGYIREAMAPMGKERFIEVFTSLFTVIRGSDARPYPRRILLICGERDRTGNIAKAMRLWGGETGVEYHCIKGASHNANQDAPDEVNAIIGAFMRRIAAEGSGPETGGKIAETARRAGAGKKLQGR
jgi:pimeloyl-ACP methyl ester carboxylesterase